MPLPREGWRDLIGTLSVKGPAGTTDPHFDTYRGTIKEWSFPNSAAHVHEAFFNFHVPHDYAPGTDMFIHVHWSQIVVDTGGAGGIPGNVKWSFDTSLSRGHGTPGGAADPFRATKTVSVVQQGSTTQYGHLLAEVQLTSTAGSTTLFEHAAIEVDGIIQVRLYRDSEDASDTLNQTPFVHSVDIHYLSLEGGTLKRVPPFYR